ncbi:cytochrome P450 [Aspergillus saccharolyticus JOP 1030-1]|uniref:Cytochrome P450 n=1 Tax=Aspergillus saccharolyticus JOP 1030-1 TaxID=1450539 RepID=A0A318ZIV7_9EURO|nr:cytochrome P450 [Aspergillus saccharolyticus JOP 1030-1]PYH46717.1 cytochrome P450 [Aspergillus saccharolyticus JOP 1030-1]
MSVNTYLDLSKTLYTVVFAVFLSGVWRLSKIGRRAKALPPGPPTLPILGNLHQISSEKRHLQFEKWSREYGPIYSLVLGTRTMIVLNSAQAVKDLLDRRGAIYSSRPDSYVAQDVLSGGLRVLFMEDGATWKSIRQLAHRILNVAAARTYVPYQDLENRAMLKSMLETPAHFVDHIRRYSGSLTTQMAFGFRTTTIEDPKFKQAFDTFDRNSEIITSKTAVLLDLFPILRSLPDFMLPVVQEARAVHRQERQLFRDHYLDAKRRLQDGTAKPCFCVDLVRLQQTEGFSDDMAAYISGALLQAGSETTASILVGFVQALVIYPEVARAAQAELDRVCGDRLPDLNDVPDLPYIRACAKETLRWMPGFLLGVPHATTQEDTYMGYRIPKGATVIVNVWALHSDPDRYPNPRRFDPMRFIEDHQTSAEAATNANVRQRDHFVFGAGRRRCQGMHIADRSMYLAISRLLWAFDFQRVVDPVTQREVVPDQDALVEGLMAMPKPFPVTITPRSGEKAQRVREEWETVQPMLDEAGQWKSVPEGLIWKDEVETV